MTNKPKDVRVSRELRSALAMVLNALDRDAEEGKAARGEMAAEIRTLLAQPADQQGEPVMRLEAEKLIGGDGEYAVDFVKPGWLAECRRTGGTFFLYAQPATAKVDERAEFDRAFPGFKAMVRDDKESLIAGRRIEKPSNMFMAWQARAKLNGGQS